MSEQSNEEAAGDQARQQQVSIHNIYLKDASFESPAAPGIFQHNAQPRIQVNVGVNTDHLSEDTFDVVLTVTVTAKFEDDKTAFLAEILQGGVFSLKGFNDNELGAMLGIYCPNMLFPYAREAIAGLVSRGGFPQLVLQPVNFEAIYAQHLQRQQGGEAQA